VIYIQRENTSTDSHIYNVSTMKMLNDFIAEICIIELRCAGLCSGFQQQIYSTISYKSRSFLPNLSCVICEFLKQSEFSIIVPPIFLLKSRLGYWFYVI
jgi:hypothetical protein